MDSQNTPTSLQVRWVLWNVQTGEVVDIDHHDPASSLQQARKHLQAEPCLHNHIHWMWLWGLEVEGTIDPTDFKPLSWSDPDLLQWATT